MTEAEVNAIANKLGYTFARYEWDETDPVLYIYFNGKGIDTKAWSRLQDILDLHQPLGITYECRHT